FLQQPILGLNPFTLTLDQPGPCFRSSSFAIISPSEVPRCEENINDDHGYRRDEVNQPIAFVVVTGQHGGGLYIIKYQEAKGENEVQYHAYPLQAVAGKNNQKLVGK